MNPRQQYEIPRLVFEQDDKVLRLNGTIWGTVKSIGVEAPSVVAHVRYLAVKKDDSRSICHIMALWKEVAAAGPDLYPSGCTRVEVF